MNVSQKKLNKLCRSLQKEKIVSSWSYRKIRVKTRKSLKFLERIGIKTII